MKRFFIRVRRKLRFYAFNIICHIMTLLFQQEPRKVLFLSDNRAVMGGNLKSIYDYLEDKDYQRTIEFKADRRLRRSFKHKFRLAYNMVTAKYILLEDLSTAITYFPVRHGQEIVQLWHGPGAYKRFGYSRKKTGEKIGTIHRGYRKYTKAIVSGEAIRWCYSEAFGLPLEKVQATGFPRTDDFYHEDYLTSVREKLYWKYPALRSKKVILFAPTYRGTNPRDAYYDFDQLDLDAIYEKYHEEAVFIIKWHPALYNNLALGKIKGPDYSRYHDFYLDLSEYRDVNELLVICDLLITDYSSLIFDYVLLNKPIIYYTYDLEAYTGYNGRGLYFDFDEYVYGAVAKTPAELLAAMDDKSLYEEKRKNFFNKFMNACDGHATERSAKYILKG